MDFRDKLEEIKRILHETEVQSVEIEYDDNNFIILASWLKVNPSILFDGVSLSLSKN